MSSPAERLGAAFDSWNRSFPSAGRLALAALLLAILTGVPLATGYDVTRAADSLSLLALSSRSGRWLRALHAWSSHAFLVLTLLHAAEHLAAGSDRDVSRGPWLRLALAVPLIVGLPLSGFMLKGDAEGALARRVFEGLVERLPLVGTALTTALLGLGDDLQNVYLHHAATLTLVVGFVAIEHGRRLWPTARAVAGLLAAIALLSLVAPPALLSDVEPVVLGPWYLVGLQEALRWLPDPDWVWLPFFVAVVTGLITLPLLGEAHRRLLLRAMVGSLAAYAALCLGAGIYRSWPAGGPPAERSSLSPHRLLAPMPFAVLDPARLPEIRGRREGCVACHAEVTGLTPAHDPQALGCFACHLGDPLAPGASAAHRGMVRVPGNLDTAARTCGQAGCHGGTLARVQGSLMATMRGVIAVDRWAFGERPTPDGEDGVAELGTSPADLHLRQLCVRCHLGEPKLAFGPPDERSRGGGCAACHHGYPERRDYSRQNASRFAHPAVSAQVADESCLGCHGRSGRISLSYGGWWESELSPEEAAAEPPGSTRLLADGRVLRRATEDAHRKTMACIDCHTGQETMGDGKRPLHEEQATRVRCQTCHRTSPPRSAALASVEVTLRALVKRRSGEAAPPERLLLEDVSGEPLTGASPGAGGAIEIRPKLGGPPLLARPPARACSALAGHERLSCRACHETWVTQCVGCHTQWDRSAERHDVPTGSTRPGAWVEYEAAPRVGPPALGVLARGGASEIVPFAPGMIMTWGGPEHPAPQPLPESAAELLGPSTPFLRAYAPAVPHTTTRRGLSCEACHRDPQVLGYGRGELQLSWDGRELRWHFEPSHEAGPDGLPQDAWIAPLDPRGGVSTRREARPLSPAEQEKVLRVGACLACHRGEEPMYADFGKALGRMRKACRGAP